MHNHELSIYPVVLGSPFLRRTLRGTKNFKLITALICGLFILAINAFAYAESIDDIRIIKISPQDQRAIIKTTERELRIIKVGDKIQVERSYQQSAVPVNPKGLRHGAGSYQQRNEQLNKIVELKVTEIAEGRTSIRIEVGELLKIWEVKWYQLII